jgi:CRISPR-associated endoribonuclease Cas6
MKSLNYVKLSIIINSKAPFFIGSQIRGTLGYALKEVVCINPTFNCDGCFAKNECIYHDFYEDKNQYQKYRLDFELGNRIYDFSIYLFDNATSKLPFIILAFVKTFRDIGLGKNRVIFDDFKLFVNDNLLSSSLEIENNFIKNFIEPDEFESRLTLELKTPLRIKKRNSFIKDGSLLELKDILNSIKNRYDNLIEVKRPRINFEGKISSYDLVFKDLSRFSNRQKTKMKLGGLVGKVKVENLNKESYRLLKLGEVIGVGKQTTFGLGKILLS